MECFVIIVNGWKPLTIITKHATLDVAATLDTPLIAIFVFSCFVATFLFVAIKRAVFVLQLFRQMLTL